MAGLPSSDDPNVLVGTETGDDAAVYRIADDRALVFTVDIITPIVDDPFTFGRIAATNSLSDIYAMGGRPLMALNVACFSPKLSPEVGHQIVAGAAEQALGAGCPVLGGHSIKDEEIKFGLAVVGEVHPDQILTNAGAQPGDVLVLTKPLGTACLATAFKAGRFDEDDPWYADLVHGMTTLNAHGARVAREHHCHAMTDITGFGLSGHLLQMARASNVTVRIEADRLPVLPGALDMLAEGYTCGGAQANLKQAARDLRLRQPLSDERIGLLHDPQTAGPLLLALPASELVSALASLRDHGFVRATRVGEVLSHSGVRLEVV